MAGEEEEGWMLPVRGARSLVGCRGSSKSLISASYDDVSF